MSQHPRPIKEIGPSGIKLELLHEPARTAPAPVSILFVPGAYHGAWAFQETWMPFFAQHGYNTYAMSYRGHGASEGDVKGAGVDDYIADLRQAISEIPGLVVLVGHSMGGNLIQMHLTTENAAGAVIMCTSTCDDVRRAGPRMLRWPFAVFKYLITGNMEHLFHDREICRQVFFAGDKSSQAEYALDHITLQPESNLVLKQLMYLETGKFKEPTPTLIIGGGKDSSIPKSSLEARAQKYDGQLKFYEDRCHEFFLLDGWEEVAHDVLEWIQNVQQAAA